MNRAIPARVRSALAYAAMGVCAYLSLATTEIPDDPCARFTNQVTLIVNREEHPRVSNWQVDATMEGGIRSLEISVTPDAQLEVLGSATSDGLGPEVTHPSVGGDGGVVVENTLRVKCGADPARCTHVEFALVLPEATEKQYVISVTAFAQNECLFVAPRVVDVRVAPLMN